MSDETDQTINQMIKGYELRQRIGAGGFGAVYRAYQAAVNREVAIKVVLPELANQPDFVRRFEVEAQLVARLEHPYIVPLYDYWREPAGAYLVMRFLRGGSLHRAIDKGPIAPEATVRIIDQITAALAVAHRNGIIHRDIKPDNILLDEDGNAYLTDFGIAKVQGSNDTEDQGVTGSPAYISPEQIKSQPTSPQTDIYGLGIVIYEMLSGQHPFPDATTSGMMIMRHLQRELPNLSHIDNVPVAVNSVIQKATAKEPANRYPDVLTLGAAFKQAMSGGMQSDDDMVIDIVPLNVAMTNPYKGLRPFGEADALDFFGREALILRLVKEMAALETATRFLAVVGPSGSGKSSVIKAGVVPALRNGALPDSDRWFFVEMFPGVQPIQELANSLLSVAVTPPTDLLARLRTDDHALLNAVEQVLPDDPAIKLLLVIDQFEELFTQVEDEAVRSHFLTSLMIALEAPNSRLRVIVTLRADFYDRPLLYAGFGEWMRQRTEVVLPLSPDELEQAIVGPAQRVGVIPDTDLVSAIVADVSEQPGALPLLQYALTELFERRDGHVLKLAAYRDIGGVTGALARRADTLYAELDAAGQEATRQLFLRLVTLGEGTEDTRRRVRRSELTAGMANATALDAVIDLYGKFRLLTFDRDPITRGPTVEVAHEALIRTWVRLRGWLNDSREGLRIQRRLTIAATEWDNARREASFLANGARLDQFEQWAAETDLGLNAQERAYLTASTAARADQSAAEQARRSREAAIARRAQNFGRAAAILGIVGVLAIVATIVAALTAVNAGNQSATATVAQGLAILSQQTAASNAAHAQAAVQVAGETLTPVGPTLTAVQNALQSGSDRLATATNAQGLAQAQVVAVGQTLTPVGPTLTAVYDALQAGNSQLATANIAQAQAQAQAQMVGQTLTPVGPTLTAVQNALQASRDRLATATIAQGLAQAQAVAVGQTLTPVGPTLTAVYYALQAGSQQLATAKMAQNLAQSQALAAQETLTPIPVTLTAVAQKIQDAQQYSTSLRLLAEANSLSQTSSGNAELAALLAIRALKISYSSQADATLLQTLIRLYTLDVLVSHTGPVNGVAFSPDGKMLLTGSADKTVILWDAMTDKQIRQFMGHTDAVLSVAFAHNGKTILTGSADKTAILWDVTTGKQIHQFSGHTGEIRSVAFGLDDKTIFTGSADGNVILWDAATGKPVGQPFDGSPFAAGGSVPMINSIALSPDGKTIVTAEDDGTARLWNVSTRQEIREFDGHTGNVLSVSFAPKGAQIFTTSQDKTVREWDIQTGKELRQFTGHADWVTSVMVSPDGKTLLTGSYDGTARLWDVQTAKELRQLTGHGDWVLAVAFSPDGKTLLTGSRDDTARVWAADNNGSSRVMLAGGQVSRVAFSPDSKLILAVSSDGSASLWNAVTGELDSQLPTDKVGSVTDAVFSPDGSTILIGNGDYNVLLWDIKKAQLIGKPFKGHTDVIYGVAFSPDGKTILTGSADKTAILWNVSTGQTMGQPLTGHTAQVHEVAFSPDGKTAATASYDGTARLWDVATGHLLQTLTVKDSQMTSVAFSPDGKTLLTGSNDGVARLWDIQSGQKLKEFTGHTTTIEHVIFSPYGKTILTTSDDMTSRLWNVADGQQLRSLVGHTGFVFSGAFSPDGKLIVTGSDDKTIRLWDVDYHDMITYACTQIFSDFSDQDRKQYTISDQDPTCPQTNLPLTATPTPTQSR